MTAFAVGMVDTGGRFVQPARQRGDIPQTRRRPGAGRRDDEIRQFIEILKLTSGVQTNGFAAGGDFSGAGNDVEPAEQGGKLVQRNAARGHFGQGNIDVDLLANGPADGDLRDAGNQNQRAAQLLCISHQFRITEFIPGNGEEEAEYVAEIVIHKGREDAGRELTRGITHAAAQLIPNLRQFVRVIA